MRRFVLVIAAVMSCAAVSAQWGMGGMGMMGGMMGSSEKTFYEAESDSIVQACLYDLPFFLDAKASEKFGKLIKEEYEEICREMMSTVFQYLMSHEMANRSGGMGGMNFGGTSDNGELDQAAIRKHVDEIRARYNKKYKKMLDDEQYEQWSEIEDKRYGRGMGYLLAHVYENTTLPF